MRHNSQKNSEATEASANQARPFASRLLRGGRLTKWKGKVASYAPWVAQLVLPAALVFGLASGPAAAVDFYWDGSPAVGGNAAADANGGSGTWNTTNTNWDDAATGGGNTAWVNSNSNRAFFGGTAGTVTLGAPITANSLTFTTNGYTLSGGTLTLAGPGAGIDVSFGATTTITSAITGTDGLNKAGSGGTLILQGTNSLTGGITVSSGALRLQGANSAGNTVLIKTGARLDVGHANAFGGDTAASLLRMESGSSLQIISNVNFTHNITLLGPSATIWGNGTWNGTFELTGNATATFGEGTVTVTGNLSDHNGSVLSLDVAPGSAITFSGNLSHTGGMTVRDRAVLSGANTYSGATVVARDSGGTSKLTYMNAGAISANSNVVLGDADSIGLIQFGYAAPAITLGTGGGQFRFDGDGGFVSRPGGVDVSLTLNGGAGLTWGAGNFIGDGRTLYLGTDVNPAMVTNARALRLTNNIDLGAQQRTIYANGGDFDDHAVLSGVLSGVGGGLKIIGEGALELTGANTYTGATEVQSTLVLNNANAIAGGFGFAGGQSNLQLNGLKGSEGTGSRNDGIVVLTAASGDFLRGLGTGGDQVQWLATGDGGFTARGGDRTVNIGNGAALTWGQGGFVGDGRRLAFGGDYGDSAVNFQNAIDLNGQTRTIEVNSVVGGGLGVSLNGVISGDGGLTIVGNGNVALTQLNTFTGRAILGDGGLPTTTFSDGLKVTVATIGKAGDAGNLGAGDTIELKAHAGVLSYTGTGETTDRNWIMGGRSTNAIISINNDGSGALELTGNITKDATGTANTLRLGGTFTGTANIVSGVIADDSGTLHLEVRDGTTWRLTGNSSTYSGPTTITSGVLEVVKLANGDQASSIGSSSNAASNLVIGNNSTLSYIGTGDSTDRLMQILTTARLDSSGTGAVHFTNTGLLDRAGSATGTYGLTLGGTNTGDNTYALTLTDIGSGGLGITKDGAGRWALTTDNNARADAYTGNTTITGGALKVDHAGAITGGLGTDSSHGLTGSDQRSSLIVFNGTAVTGGVLGLTAASGDFTRGLTTEADAFLNNNGTAVGVDPDGTGPLPPYGPEALDDDNYVQGVRWTGSGGFAAWDGTQVVNIGGNATPSTLTWNTGGFVTTGNALIFGYETADGTVDFQNGVNLVNAARTIRTNNGSAAVDAIMSGVISGTGTSASLVKEGTGTLALTNANTYSGVTTIRAGTLQVGNNGMTGTLGTGNVTVAAGANIAFDRSNTYVVNNQITGDANGAGTLIQQGTGTTELTAANNSVGATEISAGILQVNTGSTLTTPTIAFNQPGATVPTLTVIGTVQGTTGGAQASITGDDGASNINVNTGGILRANGDLGGGTDIVTMSGTLNTGGAQLNLGQGNDTLILNNAGVLTGGVDGGTGGESGPGDTLQVVATAARTLDAANVANFETLLKQGTGALTLTGNHNFSAGTDVQAGTLFVNGQLGTGPTTVASGAILAGSGTIGGNVTIANGATLRPGGTAGAVSQLTIDGDLTLNNTSIVDVQFGQAGTVGGAQNDLIVVNGALTLDGQLTVTQSPGGTLGPGVYRIISYTDGFTNNGLTSSNPDYYVQTSIGGQVNLVNTGGQTLSFWDGQVVAQKNNNTVNGGDGTWQGSTGNDNWTIASGQFNAPFTEAAIAVFAGTAGTVTVDNDAITGNVIASGMQFLTNGYVIQGEAITLVPNSANPGQSVITVGDGTVAGASITATISAELAGTTQLVKADLGTLILSGPNSYTGGTAINGGVLQIVSNGNLGHADGALSFNGGTLRNTDVVVSSRAVTLNAGGGTFDTQADLVLNGLIGGAGSLTKTGAQTLILTANDNYNGGTTISAGTLQLGTGAGGSTGGAITGNVLNNGTLAFNRSNDYLFAGTITGSGSVTQIGGGITTLTADNHYEGGTTISAGALQLGNNTATGAITGDVLNNAALVFNRSNEYIFAGVISGTGEVIKRGDGVTILTGTNTYDGETTVEAGTLLVNGNQSDADGDTTVLAGAILGGTGTIGGDVFNSGTLSPGLPGDAPGTLTIEGDLVLNSGSTLAINFGQANVIGGAFNDHIVVGGNVTLDGVLDVTETPGGNFGPGVYRIISYNPSGTLSGPGFTSNNTAFTIQTAIDGQVNLVNAQGLTLTYWDGDNGAATLGIDGGSGTWATTTSPNDNWTDEDGDPNGGWANGNFAIFAGTSGTVTVAGSDVQAAGMQFATHGYIIGGGPLELVDDESNPGTSFIRVGDGTLAGAAFTATISSNLTGDTQLVKTDLGTLILGGVNSYSGGTAVNGGVLQVANDGNLGTGGLSFDGGTLRNTGIIENARAVLLNAGGGTFETAANLILHGLIEGEGGLAKTGSGALILTGDNTYDGPTTVSGGTLIVDGDQSDADGATTVDTGATIGGSGTIGGDVTVANGATLSPGGLDGGIGTLTIAGNLTLNEGSILNFSFGQADTEGGDLNDLVNVQGNLVLDGMLNVTETAGGTFGPGVYRVFNYSGQLTNNGLTLGSIPSDSHFLQLQPNQVNLVNTEGLALNYWDGDNGPKNNDVIDGGAGTWRATGDDNWTDGAGNINAAYANGSFAIFQGAAGTVTVEGTDVQASGMQFFTHGYVITGGPIELVNGPSTIRVGDGNSSSASYVATIESSLTGASQLVKDDYGTLVLAGENTYTGGTAIVRGTLQVAEDANLGDELGDLSFANNATLRTTASFDTGRDVAFNSGGGTFLTDDGTVLMMTGVLSGAGDFTKAGAGKLVLTADSSGYMATTRINAGTLTVNGSLCGTVNVNAGGRLEGTGTVCDTNNDAGGTVAPGDGGIGTLTVDGDYAGGGTLAIEAVLGDDSSLTDLLRVTGDTSGITTMTVTNLGGSGGQTVLGIKVVDVVGSSDGVFNLAGDYVFQGEQAVVAGAYAYVLRKDDSTTPGDDGDWYLRSSLKDAPEEPILSPAVPIYEAFASILQEFDELETLQRRNGNRSWLGRQGSGPTIEPAAEVLGPSTGLKGDLAQTGVWARVKAGHALLEPENASTVDDYEVTSWKIQGGVDALLGESDSGAVIGGLAAHFGTASADVSSFFGDGDIDVTAYGISGTLTWYSVGGFYVDTQAQASLYDGDLTSDVLGDLDENVDGWGYALSIETGQKLPLGGHWSLTPQAQLTYTEVHFDDFTDPFDADVSLTDGDRLVGRLGISVDYENAWQNEMGEVNRSHVYGITSLYYDFLDGTEVDVSGTSFTLENDELWGSVGIGGEVAWADERYALYGEALAKTSLEAFGDSYSLNGTLGFRVKW